MTERLLSSGRRMEASERDGSTKAEKLFAIALTAWIHAIEKRNFPLRLASAIVLRATAPVVRQENKRLTLKYDRSIAMQSANEGLAIMLKGQTIDTLHLVYLSLPECLPDRQHVFLDEVSPRAYDRANNYLLRKQGDASELTDLMIEVLSSIKGKTSVRAYSRYLVSTGDGSDFAELRLPQIRHSEAGMGIIHGPLINDTELGRLLLAAAHVGTRWDHLKIIEAVIKSLQVRGLSQKWLDTVYDELYVPAVKAANETRIKDANLLQNANTDLYNMAPRPKSTLLGIPGWVDDCGDNCNQSLGRSTRMPAVIEKYEGQAFTPGTASNELQAATAGSTPARMPTATPSVVATPSLQVPRAVTPPNTEVVVGQALSATSTPADVANLDDMEL